MRYYCIYTYVYYSQCFGSVSVYFDHVGSRSRQILDPYPDPEFEGERSFFFKFNIRFLDIDPALT